MEQTPTENKTLTTNRKALTVNLDNTLYGTFAEIGAGQEVSRHFFVAGGAAGTIAKSMSAYDMKFSDEIYGKASRYVSRDRLIQMMDHEYRLLDERLRDDRGSETRFFVFANTVSARNFRGTNECHGWMGLRVQMAPEEKPNDIILHVRMLDDSNILQQDALGIFGVNMIYGGLFLYEQPDDFIESLRDNLEGNRIEVDMIEFNGDSFTHHDNRILSLKLVEAGLTNAVMFAAGNAILQPSEILHKKALLVERGSFRPVTKVNIDMLENAGAQFLQLPKVQDAKVEVAMEITMKNLTEEGKIDYDDFLHRTDIINSLGCSVIVSNYFEFFRLAAYFRRYTPMPIGIVLGINTLTQILDESYYENLDGGILEAFGRLFKEDVKLYIYPMNASGYKAYKNRLDSDTFFSQSASSDIGKDVLITAENLRVADNIKGLYSYLLENGFIEPIRSHSVDNMNILSRFVLEKIEKGDPTWRELVPEPVAAYIVDHNLWGVNDAEKKAKS
ncbi:MAG: TonB-dependent receptor [Puniceicoccales bacterium]